MVNRRYIMSISYNKMWKLLVDKKMSKADLRKAAEIAPNTMTKLRRDEAVNLAILGRVCEVLDCDFGGTMDNEEKYGWAYAL
jgi:putative transcriptional regulator